MVCLAHNEAPAGMLAASASNRSAEALQKLRGATGWSRHSLTGFIDSLKHRASSTTASETASATVSQSTAPE